MKYLNQNLWKKAYLIEFHINSNLESAFAFSVPPQSEEFIYPQRISETKTFGGSVIEDYGNDIITINLSGTTINQALKIIYRGEGKPEEHLTGEEEIFCLKNLFEEFGKLDKLKNKEVYLYCLEANNTSANKNNKAWRIWPQSFEIRRTKDRPFGYDYSLSALATTIEKAAKIKFNKDGLKWLSGGKIGKTINTLASDLMKAVDDMKDKIQQFWGDNVLNILIELQNAVKVINNFADAIDVGLLAFLEIADNLLIQTYNETTALGDAVAKTVSNPMRIGIEIENSCNDLVSSVKKFKTWFKSISIEENNSWKQAENKFKASKDDLRDSYKLSICEIEKKSYELVVAVKQEISENNVNPIIKPGSNNEGDAIILSYGFSNYVYKSGDTWASIANKAYGDPSYATMLQLYNKDLDLHSISVGDILHIPNLENKNKSNYDNQIYGKYGIVDQLGIDIYLDNYDLSVANGDYRLIKDMNNLYQAITNRLNTAINSRVRNIVYGIRTDVGFSNEGKNASATYITASIEQTILSEPRVKSVESVKWNGSGERLYIEADFTSLGGNKFIYKGVV